MEKIQEEPKSVIKQYKQILTIQILEILKLSFDALEEEEKSAFLDIACCFKEYGLILLFLTLLVASKDMH